MITKKTIEEMKEDEAKAMRIVIRAFIDEQPLTEDEKYECKKLIADEVIEGTDEDILEMARRLFTHRDKAY